MSQSHPKLKFHEASELVPLMRDANPAVWESFLASVRALGIQDPITVYQGKVLDGRNRYLAAEYWREREVEIECPAFEFTGTELEALAYVLAHHQRRDLTSSQRAALAILADELRSKYEHRHKQGGTRSSNGTAGHWVKPDYDRAEKLARAIGTNRDYIFKAQLIAERDMALIRDVANGKISIMQAFYRVSRVSRDAAVESLRERLRDVRLLFEEMGAKEYERRVRDILDGLDELKRRKRPRGSK